MDFGDYIIFADESGDHGLVHVDAAYPIFVLSFCIFRKSAYVDQAVPALTHLKFRKFGHDQEIFHESDIRKKTGSFSKFGKEERENFLGELTAIISDLHFSIIAVVIQKDRLKSQYLAPGNPYNIAMKHGLERIFRFLKINGESNKMTHILFECRGKKEDAALELEFRRVCDGENSTGEFFPFEVKFVDKKSNSLGLQLADMTARPIGLYVLRPDQQNRTMDVLEHKFFKDTDFDGPPVKHGFGLKVFP